VWCIAAMAAGAILTRVGSTCPPHAGINFYRRTAPGGPCWPRPQPNPNTEVFTSNHTPCWLLNGLEPRAPRVHTCTNVACGVADRLGGGICALVGTPMPITGPNPAQPLGEHGQPRESRSR